MLRCWCLWVGEGHEVVFLYDMGVAFGGYGSMIPILEMHELLVLPSYDCMMVLMW